MSNNKEIKIEKEKLKKCNGNIKILQDECEGAIKKKDNIIESHGYVASALMELDQAIYDTGRGLSELLKQSVLFFEKAGVNFKDADDIVARDIRK